MSKNHSFQMSFLNINGFRPEQGCQGVIEAMFLAIRASEPTCSQWLLASFVANEMPWNARIIVLYCTMTTASGALELSAIESGSNVDEIWRSSGTIFIHPKTINKYTNNQNLLPLVFRANITSTNRKLIHLHYWQLKELTNGLKNSTVQGKLQLHTLHCTCN